jgi:hypothetical protein
MSSRTLSVYGETPKFIIKTSNVQDPRKALETAENELENEQVITHNELKEQNSTQRAPTAKLQTQDGEIKHHSAALTPQEHTLIIMQCELTKTRSDLQFSLMTCDLLRAELAKEKKEKQNLVSMSRMHQVQNAEVIEGMKNVQERLAKYDNALIAKDDVIAQYKEKSEVLEKRCEDALWKVVRLMREAEKRKEEDVLEVGFGVSKDDMLEYAGNEMNRLQFKVDEMAWEMEKRREKGNERCKRLREAHECTIELAGDEIGRLNGKIWKMACEMETMRVGIVSKTKDSSEVEELEQRIRKMRESFEKIETEEKAQEEVIESSESEDEDELDVLSFSPSESGWEQVSETEGESASP